MYIAPISGKRCSFVRFVEQAIVEAASIRANAISILPQMDSGGRSLELDGAACHPPLPSTHQSRYRATIFLKNFVDIAKT